MEIKLKQHGGEWEELDPFDMHKLEHASYQYLIFRKERDVLPEVLKYDAVRFYLGGTLTSAVIVEIKERAEAPNLNQYFGVTMQGAMTVILDLQIVKLSRKGALIWEKIERQVTSI